MKNKPPEAKEGSLTCTTEALRKTILALQEYDYLEFISDDTWNLLEDRFYSYEMKERNDGNDR